MPSEEHFNCQAQARCRLADLRRLPPKSGIHVDLLKRIEYEKLWLDDRFRTSTYFNDDTIGERREPLWREAGGESGKSVLANSP